MKKTLFLMCLITATVLSMVLSMTGCVATHGEVKAKNIKVNAQGVPNRYLVKSGDTLGHIANKYNLSYRNIGRLNNLDDKYTIYADQWIVLWQDKAANKLIKPTQQSQKTANTLAQAVNSNSNSLMLEATDESIKATIKPVKSPSIADNGAYIAPSENRIMGKFGQLLDDGQISQGIWYFGYEGDAVFASQNGVVLYAGNKIDKFGNLVIIEHDNNLVTAYAHNSHLLVKEKQIVKKGQRIATMGKTGATQRTGLQFQLRKSGKPINPLTVVK